MVVETLVTALGVQLATKVTSSGRKRLTHTPTKSCGHALPHRGSGGIRLELSTTPVDIYRHQCWQCGRIAPLDVFTHDLRREMTKIAHRVGLKDFRVIVTNSRMPNRPYSCSQSDYWQK